MDENEFKELLKELHDVFPNTVTRMEGSAEVWVKHQYDNAFGMMNGAWNPAMASDFYANLKATLEHAEEK